MRDHILNLASADARVLAGATVGSLALADGDRSSDLDLTFGVADDVPVDDVLGDWTRELAHELDAIHLFDLPAQLTIYRVFLLPGCLQVDLSFTPASAFRARGPKFRLLFGTEATTAPVPQPSGPSAHSLFGMGVHHAVRARFCIERGRYWHAAHWINGILESALSLACRRHGLDPGHGRQFDDLPAEVLDPLRDALVRSLERDELLRALHVAVAALLRESTEVRDVAVKVDARLRDLTSTWS